MAMNPMQRKSKISFLLGMLITLLVTGVVIVFLVFQLSQLKEQEKKEQLAIKTAYVLTQSVKSGTPITADLLKEVKVDNSVVPSNAISLENLTENTISKIALEAGTIISNDMIVESGEEVTADLRIQEYNTVVLQTGIETGDYIDIRLRMPSGQDYLVVSKKRVEIPDLGTGYSDDIIRIQMTEGETAFMSNAIVESYMAKGSYLYASKYVEAGMQNATPTYVPSTDVINIINRNSNIVKEAKDALIARYNSLQANREGIANELNKQSDAAQSNVQAGTDDEITRTKDARKQYLESLATPTV